MRQDHRRRERLARPTVCRALRLSYDLRGLTSLRSEYLARAVQWKRAYRHIGLEFPSGPRDPENPISSGLASTLAGPNFRVRPICPENFPFSLPSIRPARRRPLSLLPLRPERIQQFELSDARPPTSI